MDLVIVSHMVMVGCMMAKWSVSKPSNVYFHCLQESVQRKQPYFQSHVHCFIPEQIILFLGYAHASYIQQNLHFLTLPRESASYQISLNIGFKTFSCRNCFAILSCFFGNNTTGETRNNPFETPYDSINGTQAFRYFAHT